MRFLPRIYMMLTASLLGTTAWQAVAGDLPITAAGAVYTMSNAPDGNQVFIYRRDADGALEQAGTLATGGRGTGGGLGNQGGVVVSKDSRWLVVVNAGSDDVSVFAIHPQGLKLTDRERSDGDQPVSVTMQGNIVYVLNAGSDSISGFVLSQHGRLHKLAGSRRQLSGQGTGPAQVEFSPDGRTLVVTEKATSRLTSFPVFYGSVLGRARTIAASGRTPFGFAFGRRGQLFVSQAEAGEAGLSTLAAYQLRGAGGLTALGSPEPTTQTAACWVAITLDNRYAYTTNTGSNSISGFRLGAQGTLEPLNGNSVVASVTGGGPIDMGVTDDSRFLYVLNSRTQTIDGFRIGSSGELTLVGTVGGLPPGVNGLAAR